MNDHEVCIAGGAFVMGHEKLPMPTVNPQTNYAAMPANDWGPSRQVTLSPFFIDKFPATFSEYRECVDAGVCGDLGAGGTTSRAYRDSAFANHPVVDVPYEVAVAYCRWRGKRLPTEAEWERAARGKASTTYPWGDKVPSAQLISHAVQYSAANASAPIDGPPEVGTTTEDATPEGVNDLYGSVQQWVSDWYDPHYYSTGARRDPLGPEAAVFLHEPHEYDHGNFVDVNGERCLRPAWTGRLGDDWDAAKLGSPMWARDFLDPSSSGAGVRCARDGTSR